MKRRRVFALASCALLAGCTWVSLTDGGAAVRPIGADEAADCREVGRASARTSTHIGPIRRANQTVFREQLRLSRNEAARMGGNAIAPTGESEDGERAFIVYRCPED